MFQLQTVLTTKCNLNCRYCYMRVNSKNNHSSCMTLEDFKLVLDFLPELQEKLDYHNTFKNPNFVIAFFGGEPLLRLSEMSNITSYARGLYKQVIPTCPTNGFLLNETNENILSSNYISYSISYDGPFDNVRVNSNIPSDFLINCMKKRGVKAMVSSDNVSRLFDNFKWFVGNKIYHPSISIVRDNTWTDKSILVLKEQMEKIYSYILDNFERYNQLYLPQLFSLPILDTIMSSKMGHRRPTTCFAGTSGVAVFGDGDIYPCARFGANKRFKLGNYKTRKLNSENIKFIQKASNGLNHPDCIECTLYNVCNMGCFYAQLSFGKWKQNKAIPHVCKAFKTIYNYAYQLYEDIGKEEQYKNLIYSSIN